MKTIDSDWQSRFLDDGLHSESMVDRPLSLTFSLETEARGLSQTRCNYACVISASEAMIIAPQSSFHSRSGRDSAVDQVVRLAS